MCMSSLFLAPLDQMHSVSGSSTLLLMEFNMLDNLLYLCLFAGMMATVISLLSPLFYLLYRRNTLLRQARELEHIQAKHDRAMAIYEERKAQGRI